MILTITIPTYNRPDKVKNTVSRLIPQLTPMVKLRVLDNCSSVVVADYLVSQLGADVLNKVEVVRHRVNIGGDVNFQRCFELCETPYNWMLGDDDMVADDAVKLILEELENYKDLDLIGINFKSNCCWVPRDKPIFISSISDLATKIDTFGNWLFISTSVYKTEEYLKHIWCQAWGTYSMASQLVPPMIALSHNKTLVLSEKYIVTNVPVENLNDKWSDYQLALSLSTLLEAPVGFKGNEYRSFGQKLAIHFDCIYPAQAFCTIIRSVNYDLNKIDRYHLYIFKQLISRTWVFRHQKKVQLYQYQACKYLLKNKRMLKLVYRLVPKIKRKAEQQIPYRLFAR